jgi:hypothetical protein
MKTSISQANEVLPEDVLRHLAEALRGIRFGSVEIIVQDGKIIQIDRRERVRLDR